MTTTTNHSASSAVSFPPNPQPLTPNPYARRRGVLLLVVLSLLVLFTMIAVTFLLVAGQYRRSSRAAGRAEQYSDDPRKQLDEVFAQLVRDTTNTNSVIRGHSLLADLYGNDGVTGTFSVGAVATVPSGGTTATQFLDISITSNQLYNSPLPNASVPTQSSYPTQDQVNTAGFFNGCIFTVTEIDGSPANLTMRIVGWGSTFPGFRIRVMPLDGGLSAQQFSQLQNLTSYGRFIINGRPFNGAGFGLNPAQPLPAPTLLSAKDDNTAVNPYYQAHLVNPKYFPTSATGIPTTPGVPQFNSNYTIFGGIGGADEDYDAADPQNMFLAYVGIKPTSSSQILPSFHRPDLIAYMRTQYGTQLQPSSTVPPTKYWDDYAAVGSYSAAQSPGRSIQRQVILRPLKRDHLNFTGSNSNPTFDPANPNASDAWDVDNDGDGVTDSVWIDVGMPVQTAPDGREFKPLAAILCVDLDGRLNVNAHGNVAQADPTYNYNYTTQILPNGTPAGTLADYLVSATPASPTAVTIYDAGNPLQRAPIASDPPTLPRGSGYGPADINLRPVFSSTNSHSQFYTGILTSNNYIAEGRYGKFTFSPPPYPLPGGLAVDTTLTSIKRFDFPNSYYSASVSNFSSPSDLWGRAVMGLDYAGQPIYSFAGQPALGAAVNELPSDPYSLNLSRGRTRGANSAPSTTDNPFLPTELERVLRALDADSSALPGRLWALLNNSYGNDPARMITTESYDLPSPSMLPTADISSLLRTQNGTAKDLQGNATPGGQPPGAHIVDLLRAKLVGGMGLTTPLSATDQQKINNQIAIMLPPELVSGVRFDLNRPFGNGQDDDPTGGNGVVDEPTYSEFTGGGSGTNEAPATWTAAFGYKVPLDLNNDGSVIPPSPPAGGGKAAVNGPSQSDVYARQQYAKYLYVLMMLLSDSSYSGWSSESSPDYAELNARRIAQWAINVVDFRDADSIMTPFEYDKNPFNGWDVDGVLVTTPGTNQDLDINKADRRVVWGCEYPELLLTETLAFHDRRVADKPSDTSGLPNHDLNSSTNRDQDMDQIRVPQGSLFVELYCPHNGNASMASKYSQDLFDNSGLQPRLDLGRLAPAATPGGPQYPVWRIAITPSGKQNAKNDIVARVLARPDTASFDPIAQGLSDPSHYSLFDPNSLGGGPIDDPERIIWFTNNQTVASNNPDTNRIFYNQSTPSALLYPGQYAVVGPRTNTYLGRNGVTTANQRITFDTTPNAGKVQVFDGSSTQVSPGSLPPVLPIICVSTTPPNGWPVGSANVGVSVSEPLFSGTYYTYPTGGSPGPSGELDTYSTPMDVPQDGSRTRAGVPNAPLRVDNVSYQTRLNTNYKTALLQRLANPTVAYDALLNPYITVDWQPIDLLVFNGEVAQSGTVPDPDDPGFLSPPAALNPGADSRERGSMNPGLVDLWKTQLQPPTASSSKLGGDVFGYTLNQTLGYLNKPLGTMQTKFTSASPTPTNYGYVNAPDQTQAGSFPFSWLTWNNRPFANNAELLLVPPTSAEQLLRQYSTIANPTADPYDASAISNYVTPYQHLFNFLLTGDGTASKAPYFYRILDYVHVPSWFIGTDTYLSPASFSQPLPDAPTERSLMSMFHPPFNKVSNYRDPGRVNINTIPSNPASAAINPVWSGITDGANVPPWSSGQSPWQQIVQSRRGDTNSAVFAPNTALPSFFANPFRSAGGGQYTLPGTTYSGRSPAQYEAAATLLRPSPSGNALFSKAQDLDPTKFKYVSSQRNAYFRYQPLERVANLLTTRSNVYAVWITIGYFEVTPAPIDTKLSPQQINYAVYPDGYQLGQELGADTGEITRHRAFYIYDRSIPVCFEPGVDHNYDKGILVKRFIE